MQSSRIGASRLRSARCSIRSRKVGSPQWISSKRPRAAARPPAPRAACGPPTRSPPASPRPPRPRGSGEPTVAVVRPVQLLHHLDHRPVGDPLAVGKAAAANDRRVRRAEELLREPRLPDAGGAEHREQVARALAGDARARRPEQLACRSRPTIGAPRRRPGRLVRPRAAGRRRAARLALRLERGRRLDLDGVAHQPVGRLAEQDLARLGRLLEPRGDVDRVAGRQPLLGAGDHLAGVDADPELEPRAVAGLELVVQLGEPVPQLGGRAHGAQRVVLVHHRDAEDGHHRVADELLDRAAVPLDIACADSK